MNTYRFYGIESFMENANLEMDLANIDPSQIKYSKKVFLDSDKAKSVFFPPLGRVGFNDISYDLFSFYLPQEQKLASQNKLSEEQPFFKQFERFLATRGNDLIKQQHYAFMSLAYMEYYPNVQPHWNFISHLDNQHLHGLIQKEISRHGKQAYDFLEPHLTSQQLQDFTWTFARGQVKYKDSRKKLIDDFYDIKKYDSSETVTLNLKEMSIFYALTQGAEKLESFTSLVQKLEPLELSVNSEKIIQLLIAHELEYNHLKNCNFTELQDSTIAHASLQRLMPERSSFSLEEVGLYNQMNNNLGKMLEQYVNQSAQFEAQGLHNTVLHNPVALLEHYCEHPFLAQIAQNFLQDRIGFAKKSENRAFWSYLQIDLSLAHKYSNTEQDNLYSSNTSSGLKI
jgi:hypothetical protein